MNLERSAFKGKFAILTSLSLDQYDKVSVWDFPVKTSLSVYLKKSIEKHIY